MPLCVMSGTGCRECGAVLPVRTCCAGWLEQCCGRIRVSFRSNTGMANVGRGRVGATLSMNTERSQSDFIAHIACPKRTAPSKQ